MADQIVFYTNPMSRGRIIRWMLEEVGAPYETRVIEYAAIKSPDYLAVNPMGKVPALVHGDVVVTECAAICAYLADAFPGAGMAPAPASPARGPYYRWLFFTAGPVEAAVSNKAMGWEAPQERQAMIGYGTFGAVMETLERAVAGGPYLLGDQFTAVDVYLGAQIMWGMQFGTMEKRPGFETYAARLAARPAYVRAREIDDALIAAAKKA